MDFQVYGQSTMGVSYIITCDNNKSSKPSIKSCFAMGGRIFYFSSGMFQVY